jgi:chromatin structure-remodeling complex protein RSC7
LGGTKVGNGAWALAYIDTVMEFPGASAEQDSPETKLREKLWREAESSGEVPIELY